MGDRLKKGTESAIKRSSEISSGENERVPAVFSAGQFLMNMRRYVQATELMQAGATGQSNSAQMLALIEALRRTKRAEDLSAFQNATAFRIGTLASVRFRNMCSANARDL